MATARIDVIGGGIFGLSVAWECLRRGARVRLFEQSAIGAGASGGIVGAMAPHTPDNWNAKKQFQLDSLLAAPGFWAKVDAISGIASGYARVGRLVPVLSERELQLARDRHFSAGRFWGNSAGWEVISTDGFAGWAPRSPTGYLIHDTLSAVINPQAACQSLAGAIVARGGEITLGKRPADTPDATVLCTGAQGLADLSRALGQPIGSGEKGQAVLLDIDHAGKPQLFVGGTHIIPHSNGTVAVGSTVEPQFENARSTDSRLDALHKKACAMCPAIARGNIIGRWAGVRPRATRRTPILGAHPVIDRVYIANGGFKIGFGVSVKVGEVMADLVLNGTADIPQKFTVEGNLA